MSANLLYLSDDVKITKIADYTANGTTAVTGAEVDMAADGGWDGIMCIASFGTAAANNVITLHDSLTTGTEAATVALKASGTSDEDVVLDVLHPKRFCKFVATRGTSSVMEMMIAIQYRGRSKPVTNAVSGTIAVAKFLSPAAA